MSKTSSVATSEAAQTTQKSTQKTTQNTTQNTNQKTSQKTSQKTIDIKILDRELRVACPDEERGELLDSVAYLDKRMREIRDAGKIASVERIALMAALNITHELLGMKVGRGFDLADFKRRINTMQTAIDGALADQEKLF